MKSDLYIVTRSNIPFEADPLRYGGDKREGSDEYWIDICNQYKLNYIVLGTNDPRLRLRQAKQAIKEVSSNKTCSLRYNRHCL